MLLVSASIKARLMSGLSTKTEGKMHTKRSNMSHNVCIHFLQHAIELFTYYVCNFMHSKMYNIIT